MLPMKVHPGARHQRGTATAQEQWSDNAEEPHDSSVPHKPPPPPPPLHELALPPDVQALLDQIDSHTWRMFCTVQCKLNARDGRPEGIQHSIKDSYLQDCQIWGITAALFAAVGVSFLVLVPTDFASTSSRGAEVAQEVVHYIFVLCCIGCIMFNIAAVMIASNVYSLSTMVPPQRFLQWLVLRRHSGRRGTRNPWWWVQHGLHSLVGCVATCTYLLHGPWAGAGAAVLSAVLMVAVHKINKRLWAGFMQVMKSME